MSWAMAFPRYPSLSGSCNTRSVIRTSCGKFRYASASSEFPRDVLLRAGVIRCGEDLLCRSDLDELAVEQERRRVCHARRLLHVVRDDDDRHAMLELVDELLDLQRRDRIDRAGRLVHQQHLGLDG